jgi:thiamine-phosphate pyrophosphorylase
LPQYYAVTAPLVADGSPTLILEQPACLEWLDRFQCLPAHGVELVQLRAKELEPEHLKALAVHCQTLAPGLGLRLMLNGPEGLVRELGLTGVHLTSRALLALSTRPLPHPFLVGASCHSQEELEHSERIGVDFACLSPLGVTSGYAEGEILGFSRFAEMVANTRIPVFGLGGLTREDLDQVREAGGQGVAGISAFWR